MKTLDVNLMPGCGSFCQELIGSQSITRLTSRLRSAQEIWAREFIKDDLFISTAATKLVSPRGILSVHE